MCDNDEEIFVIIIFVFSFHFAHSAYAENSLNFRMGTGYSFGDFGVIDIPMDFEIGIRFDVEPVKIGLYLDFGLTLHNLAFAGISGRTLSVFRLFMFENDDLNFYVSFGAGHHSYSDVTIFMGAGLPRSGKNFVTKMDLGMDFYQTKTAAIGFNVYYYYHSPGKRASIPNAMEGGAQLILSYLF